jgi:hypothetical protein
MENKNERKNALARRARRLKKESKPFKFEYYKMKSRLIIIILSLMTII